MKKKYGFFFFGILLFLSLALGVLSYKRASRDSIKSTALTEEKLQTEAENFEPEKSEYELFCEYYREAVGEGTASTLFADLTHDGTEELIILNLGSQTREEFVSHRGDGELQVIDIIAGRAVVIYRDSFSASAHPGYRWYYLCEENGREYLYEYIEGIYGGAGNAIFTRFSFDAYGQPVSQLREEVLYNGNLPEEAERQAEEEKLMEFYKRSLAYEETAMPLVKAGRRHCGEEFLRDAQYYDTYVCEKNELEGKK